MLEGSGKSKILDLVWPHIRCVLAENLDASCGLIQQSTNAIECGRFATAVRANQSDEFSRAHFERDVLYSDSPADVLSEIFDP